MTKSQRFFKYLSYASLLVAVVVFVVVSGCARLFYGSLPQTKGRAILAGLAADVKVYRDAYGVPHVFAANRADALRALGYLHASERFFQMEMNRRAGQGRLAEVLGMDMVGVDKFIRTLNLYPLAQSGYLAMPLEIQDLARAYAGGVNDWLEKHREKLPAELVLLGVKPEPWQPADSMVWAKLMALQLSHNYKLEELRGQLAGKISSQQMKMLFPGIGKAPVTTDPQIELQQGRVTPVDDVMKKLASITALDHAASNEWVIGGDWTQSGKPILANDPHLSLEAPILWYLVRMVTPQGSVKGATVPGLPVVLLGQNDNIAWGLTTTGSDVQDLFIETIDPKDPSRYLTPQGSKPFDVRHDIIKVKDAPSVALTVRTTRHGPVLSDIDETLAALAGQGKVMALAFTGLNEGDRTSEALLRINTAVGWRDFLDALKLYQAPPQNMVFADIKGDIGFINPGLVPIRKKGNGLAPVDGSSGAYDWKGMIPFDQWPKLHNPDSGFVFNANNALIGTTAKNYYGTDWEEPYRALRLQNLITETETHTLATSAAMQADHVSLAARDLLPYLGRLHSKDQRVQTVLDKLRLWDGAMDRDRAEPLIFESWLYQMHKILLEEKAGQKLTERGPYAANAISSILSTKNNGWCNDAECEVLALKAMQVALDWLTQRHGTDMAQWRWGSEHHAVLQHKFFKHFPLLSKWSDLSISSNGDFYTLDRGGAFDAPAATPFVRLHGGGYRGIYDLDNPDQSRFMITTGQSGHIASPHFGDLVNKWNEVQYITLSGTEKELQAQKASLLVFQPAR